MTLFTVGMYGTFAGLVNMAKVSLTIFDHSDDGNIDGGCR